MTSAGNPWESRSSQGFERDEVKSAVGRIHKGEQAETNDGVIGLNARRLFQNGFDLFGDVVGSLQRCGRGKLHVNKEVALVFFREEGSG